MTKVENDEYGLAKVRVKTGANLSDISHIYIAKKDPDNASDESRDN